MTSISMADGRRSAQPASAPVFVVTEAAKLDGACFTEWRDARLKQVSPSAVNR